MLPDPLTTSLSRHKGICMQRATEAGIATSRLPINKYVKLADRAVLTVNHVAHIMVEMFNRRDWKEVLDIVLPPRKRADFQKNKHAKMLEGRAKPRIEGMSSPPQEGSCEVGEQVGGRSEKGRDQAEGEDGEGVEGKISNANE